MSLEKGELNNIGYSYEVDPCEPLAQMERWTTEIIRAENEGREPRLYDECDTVATVEQILKLNAKLDAL